jgi:hypothetical protein
MQLADGKWSEQKPLHPKSETEIISPLSRKGAASGECNGAKQKGIEFWEAAVEKLKAGEKLGTVAAELGAKKKGTA